MRRSPSKCVSRCTSLWRPRGGRFRPSAMRRKQPILLLACLAARALLCAQDAPSMPSWLTVYPGADEQTRRLGPLVESNYTVAAPPRDVLSHFRQLFAAAGLPFQPGAGGNGFMIRAAPQECDLF